MRDLNLSFFKSKFSCGSIAATNWKETRLTPTGILAMMANCEARTIIEKNKVRRQQCSREKETRA